MSTKSSNTNCDGKIQTGMATKPFVQLAVVILLLIGMLLPQSGCRERRPPLRDEVRAYYPERLHYFLGEYEQHGKKNPQWDPAMRQLIEGMIYDGYTDSYMPSPAVLKAFDKLDKARCDDPYFRLLSAMYVHSRTTQPYPYATHAQAYEAIKSSTYGPVIKFTTAHTAAIYAYDATDEAKRRLCFSLQAEAFEHILKAVADPSVPDEVIAAPIESFFDWSGDAEPDSAILARSPRLLAAINQHRADQSTRPVTDRGTS